MFGTEEVLKCKDILRNSKNIEEGISGKKDESQRVNECRHIVIDLSPSFLGSTPKHQSCNLRNVHVDKMFVKIGLWIYTWMNYPSRQVTRQMDNSSLVGQSLLLFMYQ